MESLILVLIVGIVSVAVVGGIMYIVLDAIAHDKNYTPGPPED